MKQAHLLSFALVLLAANTLPVGAAQPDNIHPPYVLKRLAAIKPPEYLLPWKQIPWLTDLEQAIQQARKEKRPLLLWGSDDEPLERC